MAVPDTEEMIQQADERIGRMKSRLQMRIRMCTESRLEARTAGTVLLPDTQE